MEKPRPHINYRVLVPLALVLVVMALSFPRKAKFAYDYKKGSPWKYETLVAQFDFPLLKTEEQIREEKGQKSVNIPYYRFKQEVVDKSLRAAAEMDLQGYSSLRPQLISSLEKIYSKGIPDKEIKPEKGEDLSSTVIFIQRDKASKHPATEVYTEETAKAKIIADVSSKNPKVNVDSVFRALGVFDAVLAANLEYDSKTTKLINDETAAQISTTQGSVNAGTKIVGSGETVTAEVFQKLESYKAEYNNYMGYGGPKFLQWMGNLLLALVLTLLFVLVIYFLNKKILQETRRYWYLTLVFLITVLTSLMVIKFAPKYLYMVPFTLTALYLEAFFKNKMNMPICVVSFLPLLIFADNGVVLFVMFTVASVVAVFAFKYFNQGWQQFITAVIVFVSLVLTYFSFRLLKMVNDDPYNAVILLFIGSMLNVAGYPLIYLFEKVFGLVSNSRLRELCDTNNPLLRELEQKAPGTFQHSLQVMNMADAVARAIDANVLLVRAGALYHDIGKVNNPSCFIENDSLSGNGPHFHDGLSPKESAIAIVRHVTDGIEIAKENNLPDLVIDFIRTHHGTSNTSYFYNKYLNEGGDPNDVSCFFYKGVKPQTKEQVILMICDSVEAASRTLKDNAPDTFSDFVESIVEGKIIIGQLDEADISIKQINTVKEVLKGYLSQIFHERVVYPQVNVNN